MTPDDLFSELRARLEAPPTPTLREELYAVINTFANAASKEELAAFRLDYLPPLQEKLDARWPLELRWSCAVNHAPGELMLSKLLAVNDLDVTPKQLAKALKKISPTLTRGYQGIRVSTEKTPPEQLLIPLCEKIETLTHAEIESDVSVTGALDWLIAHHGDTLRHLTLRAAQEDLNAGYSEHVTPYIGELIPRLQHLPALRSLAVNHVRAYYGNHHDYLEDLTSHPIATRLESLDLCANLHIFQDTWFTQVDVWKSLKRLRILGLPKDRADALLKSPYLQHVETWNLSRHPYDRQRDWSEPTTTLWTARAHHTDPGEVLRQKKVDLLLLPEEDLREIFLDHEGHLNPSTHLKDLYSNWFTRDVFDAILREGHIAYPNLRTLCFRGMDDYISPEVYAQINESPLYKMLDTFTWYIRPLSPKRASELSPEDRAGAYREWYTIAMSQDYGLSLRKQAWRTILDNLENLPDYKLLAKIVELPGRSKLGKDDLEKSFEAMTPRA